VGDLRERVRKTDPDKLLEAGMEPSLRNYLKFSGLTCEDRPISGRCPRMQPDSEGIRASIENETGLWAQLHCPVLIIGFEEGAA